MDDEVRAMIAGLPEKLFLEVGLAVLSDNAIDALPEAASVVAQRGWPLGPAVHTWAAPPGHATPEPNPNQQVSPERVAS